MPGLTIPLRDLDAIGKDYVFSLDAAWFAGALEGTGVRGDVSQGPGSVEVHAQLNGREVLVHGRARASFAMECGRCLTEVPIGVSCDLAALYAEGVAPADHDEDAEDIDPDAPDREYYKGDSLAIDGLVRDYLLLELPMHPRCEDAGLSCSNLDVTAHLQGATGVSTAKTFGEGAIDPRLMPLMKLAKGERDKE